MELFVKCKRYLQFKLLTGASSEEDKTDQDGVKYQLVSDSDDATDLKAEMFKSRTVDDILDDVGLRWAHFKAYLLLGLLNIADSLEVSTLAIILPSVKAEWHISPLLQGVLTLSLPSGMFLGSTALGWILDKYGRKRGLIGSATFILVFAMLSAFSQNYYWLWFSMFFVGVGATSCNQTYVMCMELFPPKYRSTFSTLNSISWTVGFLLSSIASIELSVIGWRGALAVVCVPVAIFLVGISFLPDTPHYYLAAGDEEKALSVLQGYAPEMDLSDVTLKRETPASSKQADITQLFRSGVWKITLLLCVGAFCNSISYYDLIYLASDIASNGNTTLEYEGNKLGYSENNLYVIMAWMNLPELVVIISTAIACYIFPAKPVLMSLYFLPVVLLTVGLLVWDQFNQRTLLLVFTMLSRSLVNCVQTVFLIFASLLYPTENRSIGIGVCVTVNRAGMLLGPFLFETLIQKSYDVAIVFNIVFLFLGLVSTAFLPSCSSTLS